LVKELFLFVSFIMIIYIDLMQKNNKYLKVISKIEKIRSKNNVNWMDILRLAFKLDPIAASKIMKKINHDDKEITKLLSKLAE
jgi:hypothetical protein